MVVPIAAWFIISENNMGDFGVPLLWETYIYNIYNIYIYII